MFDSTTQFALDNLARQLDRAAAGETDDSAVAMAARALLRATSPAAVEDRQYYDVDLDLPTDKRCRAEGKHGRVCGRRANHVSDTHRDLEFSWAVTA
jgi:hypothetical protein